MKIYNQQWEMIESPDLDLGYLIKTQRTILCYYEITQEEIGHYETVEEFPNGGKAIEWIIDAPEEGQWVFYDNLGNQIDCDIEIPNDIPHEMDMENIEECLMYIPYTFEELKEQEKEASKISTNEILNALLGIMEE